MSYEADAMRALTIALRNSDGLKYALKDFNSNIEVLKFLSIELAKANELEEIKLGLRRKEDYSYTDIFKNFSHKYKDKNKIIVNN